MNIIKRIRNKIKKAICIYKIKKFTKNKDKLDLEIKNFKEFGIQNRNEKPRIIVSLTSFPQRMQSIHFCLYSLLKQSFKPDILILWLAEEQFPNKEKDIPQSVLKLCENGLSIKWTKDIRSYKKLIPALREFPDDIVISADDDIFYHKTWLKKLFYSYKKNPKCISAHRVHRILLDKKNDLLPYNNWEHSTSCKDISILNFPTTGGGALYPPHCLDKEVFNEDAFKKLAPDADDVWFWAMALKKGTKIKNTGANLDLIEINYDQYLKDENWFCLHSTNKIGGNDKQLKAVLGVYNLYEKLKTK